MRRLRAVTFMAVFILAPISQVPNPCGADHASSEHTPPPAVWCMIASRVPIPGTICCRRRVTSE